MRWALVPCTDEDEIPEAIGYLKVPSKFHTFSGCKYTGFSRGKKHGWWICGQCKRPTYTWWLMHCFYDLGINFIDDVELRKEDEEEYDAYHRDELSKSYKERHPNHDHVFAEAIRVMSIEHRSRLEEWKRDRSQSGQDLVVSGDDVATRGDGSQSPSTPPVVAGEERREPEVQPGV